VPAAAPQRRTPAAARYAGQPAETVLEQARAFLRQQQADAAAEAWDYLVSDGQMVETAITELEGAAEARASVPLLRVLGDAYVRGNHLQAALDTYRQALRRL
jgi:hypothetical protein